jgi:hypothetical protein
VRCEQRAETGGQHHCVVSRREDVASVDYAEGCGQSRRDIALVAERDRVPFRPAPRTRPWDAAAQLGERRTGLRRGGDRARDFPSWSGLPASQAVNQTRWVLTIFAARISTTELASTRASSRSWLTYTIVKASSR